MDEDDSLPGGAAEAGPSTASLGSGHEATGRAASAMTAAAPVQQRVLGIPPDLNIRGDHERCTMFEPPLYIQRYTTVCQLLADSQRYGNVSKVLDIGCSEMTFLQYLKTVASLTDITLLDISEDTLRRHLHRAAPGARDRLERRLQPLRVRVFCGDVTQPDARLLGCDAVTGIEVIEHLEPAVLEAVPAAVFGFLRPRLVVFTTPNSEFNQLFPDFSGMRHWDHKFEWTRAEFRHWCGGVVARYPEYEVSFDGIGDPPAGSEHLGCCSQIAVFSRRGGPAAPAPAAADPAPLHPYRLLSDREFPFETREDRLYSDVLYYTRQIGYDRSERSPEPRREELIPLAMIAALPSVAALTADLDELVSLLSARGVPVVVRDAEPHVVYRPSTEDSASEDELAGGDLWPSDEVTGPEVATGDSAAGDASYHDDWESEPDWEQEIMASQSWDSHAGCDWAARPVPDLASSDSGAVRPADDPPTSVTRPSGSGRRWLIMLPTYRLALHLLRACFPASWRVPLAAALLPSIVVELNCR